PAARPAAPAEAPRSAASGSPAELLKSVEEVQRKEVAALKAMVELLIEKGVFSREEYLAKVKR
ncbi:general secretion pathway protein GspE, partial [Corallococcus terminator]